MYGLVKTPSYNPPKDPFHLVYIIFYWMGVGILLPWNFFINATDYWMYKFRRTDNIPKWSDVSFLTNDTGDTHKGDDDNGYTPLQLKWNSYLSIATMVPNVSLLLLNACFGHKFRVQPRMVVSLVGVTFLFIISDVMTKVNTDNWQEEFLAFTLVTVVILTAFVAVLQGGLFGLAGKFPPAYMGAVNQGQAVGGIVVALINILTLAAGVEGKDVAFYCFLFGTLFLLTTLMAFVAVTKTQFFKFYITEEQVNGDSTAGERSSEVFTNESSLILNVQTASPPETSTCAIVRKIWIWALSVFFSFMITLSVFPSVTVLIESTKKGEGNAWNDTYFVAVGCFLVFNVGDYLGRIMASTIKRPHETTFGAWTMFIATILRFAFIPLFLFCNASPHNRRVTNVFFKSDAIYLLLMVIFSVSNGYIGTLCLMFGPKTLSNPVDQGRAASILVFFLVFGLCIGAILSQPLLRLL